MLLLLLCMELLWTINYEYFYDEFVVMPWKKGIQNGEKLWCSVTASKICTLYINGIVFTKIQFLWSSKGIFLIFLIFFPLQRKWRLYMLNVNNFDLFITCVEKSSMTAFGTGPVTCLFIIIICCLMHYSYLFFKPKVWCLEKVYMLLLVYYTVYNFSAIYLMHSFIQSQRAFRA